MMKFVKWMIPQFNSFEEFIASSWLAVRISVGIVFVMATQSKVVVAEFSSYSGWVLTLHSFAMTFIFAFALLSFTVKLSHLKKGEKMRGVLTGLLIFFTLVEFALNFSYHVIVYSREIGSLELVIPPIKSPRFLITTLIDLSLPTALIMFGHTIHMKSENELSLFSEDKQTPSSVNVGDVLKIKIGDSVRRLEIAGKVVGEEDVPS